jgi:RNA polymerase sigma factor (sigma-70 family)
MVATTPDADALWDAYRACRSVENRNALVMAYLPNVERHLSRVRNAGIVQRTDVRQWAAIALIAAVEKFDHRPGIKFTSFLASRVRWAIVNGFRVVGGRRSCQERGRAHREVCRQLPDSLEYWLAAPPQPNPIEVFDTLRRALRGLSARQRTVILCRFGEGLTIKETAATLGICGQTVINDSRAAMAHMRERVESCRQEQ